MHHCKYCGADHDVEDLVRRERDGLVRVHCPDCKGPLGTYRDPARAPGGSR